MLAALLCAPAFALTDAEVEAQVAASSKEAVTGNVLIWFLCAVAFLKVSQKIDSILGTLGINVGRTGGSLMAEAMIAARGVTMIAKAGGHAVGGAVRSGGGSAQNASSGSTGGFFKGGLIGMAGRHITNSAVKTATSQTAAVHTTASTHSKGIHSQSQGTHTSSTVQGGGISTVSASAAHTDTSGIIQTENSVQSSDFQSDISGHDSQESSSVEARSDSAVFSDALAQQEGVIIAGHESQSAVHSGSDTQSAHTRSEVHTVRQTSIGGAVFARSLASGGKFANEVIGSVARGEASGRITGAMAEQSLASYLGYTAIGKRPPVFSNAEIGGGRITGNVSTPEHPQPIAFGMYHAGQYAEPSGTFSKIRSADGTLWYSQLAQDTVECKPYKAPDGSVAYEEKIVKKLPTPPKRKDRM